jgi:hypothetical protein
MKLPTKQEIEEAELELHGIWYHVNLTGQLYEGMHEFKFNHLIDLGTNVELLSKDNENQEFKKIVGIKEFLNKYFRTEKEAWKHYIDCIDKELKHHKEISKKLEQIKDDVIRKQHLETLFQSYNRYLTI